MMAVVDLFVLYIYYIHAFVLFIIDKHLIHNAVSNSQKQ